jgi:hypothetical protein
VDEEKNKGGRPNQLKFCVPPDDYKELEKMGKPTASAPDQMAAMLLHLAIESFTIEVRRKSDNGKL